MEGIDVSKHQGTVDWDKVKAAGVEFALLRAGFGSLASQKDPTFERNYAECKRVGIPVGAYLYSYAVNTEEAKAEAENLLRFCEGKQFEYPLWFDQEYEPGILALTNAQRTEIVKTFCNTVQVAGWYCGLYASTDFINNRLNDSELTAYDVWAAQYGPACTCKLPFGIWQYTSSGAVDGISGRVDRNTAYKDYPAIIRAAGLNGYAAGTPDAEAGTTSLPLSDEPAVMSCWATGADKMRLKEACHDLAIGYAEEGDKLTTLSPVSRGDQITLVRAAALLGIEWSIPQTDAEMPQKETEAPQTDTERPQETQTETDVKTDAPEEKEEQEDAQPAGRSVWDIVMELIEKIVAIWKGEN